MLHISHSTLTLKDEIRIATSITKDIVAMLDALTETSDFKKEIRPFIDKIKDQNFKVLGKDATDAVQVLRKVCSGEIEIPKAHIIFTEVYDELKSLETTFEDFTGKVTLQEDNKD